jgi:hypothetical protein
VDKHRARAEVRYAEIHYISSTLMKLVDAKAEIHG